jgi:hypothetical protein
MGGSVGFSDNMITSLKNNRYKNKKSRSFRKHEMNLPDGKSSSSTKKSNYSYIETHGTYAEQSRKARTTVVYLLALLIILGLLFYFYAL